MKGKFLKMLAAGSMAAAMLAGCSSSDSSSSSSSEGASLGDTVKIGLNYELSGAVSDYGQAERDGSELAIKLFNEREDKPFTVEAVETDTKSDVAESTTQATKLIEQDGVVAIIGPATSGSSIATFQIATDSSVPVVTPSATQVDAMLNNGTPYEYAWRVCFEDSYQGKAMALFSYDTLDTTKAIIFNEVSDYGQGLATAFKDEFESLGGTVVDQIQYNSGDTDFSSYITKIKSEDFDVIYIAGYYNEAGLIIKQAKDNGIDVPIVGADGFDAATLVEKTGADYANDVYFTTGYTTVDANDAVKSFVEAYEEEYGKEPAMFAALAFDATNLVLDQLEATGATGAELNEAIKNASFTGVTGSFTFDENTHTPLKSVLVVELVDGVQSNATEVSVD